MNKNQLAHQTVAQASAGGSEAEVYINVGKETEIQVSRGEVEKLTYAGSKGLGIRVIKDGRMGFAYTSDFSDESISRTIQAALQLAEMVDADRFRTLPERREIPGEDLRIYDPAVENTAIEEKIAFAMAVEQAALAADPRVQLALRTTYADGVDEITLVNSKGFSGSYKKSIAAAYTQAMAAEGQERAMAFGLGIGTSLAELDAQAIGEEAGKKAAGLLGGRAVPTQRGTIVYSPFAAAGLVGALSRALSAEAMQRNRSFLQDKMGEDVAADMVSVLDNGRLPGGLATRPFDAEGNPTRATRLIDEGVLQAVLYDSYSASRDGTDSTGNAGRVSHRQPPILTPSNFYIQPGTQSPEEIIAGVKRGLYVVNTMNTHSINPANGDYSVSAQGYWIEDGKLAQPVNNVTIALPLDQLLLNVKAVANDLVFVPFGGAIGSPTFRVDGVMIGGEGV